MKKVFIYTLLSIVGFAVLTQAGILDSLIAFLLAGAIPGTDYSVPSGFMLLLIATISWLLILRYAPFQSKPVKRARKRSRTKKRMPARRYSQI